MTDLVFFGAGASKPFGIPTMQKMVVQFEHDLKDDKKLHDFYHKIKDKLIEGYGPSIDIESILSVLGGITKKKRPRDLGHFVFYYVSDDASSEQFSPDEIELAKKLQEKIYDYIRKVCKINNLEEFKEEYDRSYLPLFKHISEEKIDYNGEALAHEWKAYTTNYDDIFEGFWRDYRLPEDHFKPQDSSENRFFDIKSLTYEPTFCKLHGSLDWMEEVEGTRIVRKTCRGHGRITTKDNVMLFPTQQKDVYAYPWFALFHDLQLGLSQKRKLYAIGYAFNDEFIKNAFQDALARNSAKKLIIINPDAEQIKGKFPKSVRKQIEVLPISFGGKFFELQFEDHVKRVKTLVVRFYIKHDPEKMNYRLLAIKSNCTIKWSKIINFQENGILERETSPPAKFDNYVSYQIPCLHDMEIKLELQISYIYGGEIELYISDGTDDPIFEIDYCFPNIANSGYIKNKYKEVDGTWWPREPIKLDTTKLYRRQ